MVIGYYQHCSHKRSFLGMTIHYVEEENLSVVSTALVCRRFKVSHTGEAIGKMLFEIFEELKLTNKVINAVTDNAANFAKAFALFPSQANEAAQSASAESLEYVDESDSELVSASSVADLLDEFDVSRQSTEYKIDTDDHDDIVLP